MWWIQRSRNARKETTSRPNLIRDPGSQRRGRRNVDSTLTARGPSGNSAGQRDSGKHGASSGLARLPPRTSEARLHRLTWRRAEREVAVWTLVFQERWRGDSDSDSSSSDWARLWLGEPAMNQPDSIQKSRPGLRCEALPGSLLLFGFRSSDGQLETTRQSGRRPWSSARDRRSGPASWLQAWRARRKLAPDIPGHPRTSSLLRPHVCLPRFSAPCQPEIRVAGLRTLGGDWTGNASVGMRSRLGVPRGRPYFKTKRFSWTKLNVVTWEAREKREKCENSGNRSVWCSFP